MSCTAPTRRPADLDVVVVDELARVLEAQHVLRVARPAQEQHAPPPRPEEREHAEATPRAGVTGGRLGAGAQVRWDKRTGIRCEVAHLRRAVLVAG
jgi:hypothetical protein